MATGKNCSELVTTSTSRPSGRWNFTEKPCGLAPGAPSGIAGRPVESEKRTVTGTGLPANSAAALYFAPAAVGANTPSVTRPLAWLARMPGFLPHSWFITSTVSTAVPWARAAPPAPSTRPHARMVAP